MPHSCLLSASRHSCTLHGHVPHDVPLQHCLGTLRCPCRVGRVQSGTTALAWGDPMLSEVIVNMQLQHNTTCGRCGLSIGAAAGCHWSLGPALSSELFGLRRFATLYCLLNYSTTLGAYLLATRLVRARAPHVVLLRLLRCQNPDPRPMLHGHLGAHQL